MGKMTDLTFNTDSEDLRDETEFYRWVYEAKPKYLFLLNGIGRAREIKKNLPNTTIITRAFDPFNQWQGGKNPTFDNTFWQTNSVAKVVDWMKANLANDKGFIHAVGTNELSHNDALSGKTLDDMLKWLIDFMDKSRLAGFRIAVGELASAKTIKPEDVEAGRWDDYLRAIKQHAGWHLPTFHDYTTGVLAATLMPNYPENLFNRDAIQQMHWPKALPLGTWGWHLLRHELLQNRSVGLGLGRFQYGITECPWDMMSDINNHNQALTRLKDAFGMAEYTKDIRGLLSHRNYFGWVLGKGSLSDIEFGEYAFAQLKWMAEIYPDECLFLAQFGWNQDWEIPEGADFSVPSLKHYRNLVAAYQPSEQPIPPVVTPPKEPIMLEKRIRSNATATNVRAEKSLTSAILGVLRPEWVDCLVSDDYALATWVKVGVGTLSGYVSRQYVDIENRLIETPEPSFMVDFTITMTDDVRAAFQTIATALANAKQV